MRNFIVIIIIIIITIINSPLATIVVEKFVFLWWRHQVQTMAVGVFQNRLNLIQLNLFNDDTCPSVHISRLMLFS